jgi:hypothetical protein
MSPGERRVLIALWNALVIFGSIYYLTGQFWKSAVVGIFVLMSTLLNFGARRLTQVGFVVSVITLLVFVGLVPEPGRWPELINQVCTFKSR